MVIIMRDSISISIIYAGSKPYELFLLSGVKRVGFIPNELEAQ
ncbi:hypothetical protein CYPRO_2774 [Cyclonatronum proteinivorum]|uniref:Uncharacterized protein n=1 Tax=Cyclonatronum proteinivorum TaxID=1457365 RepID=A0A345UNG1_9BACT|nr:hypothetical protein CYPRO_2774 [Cyclonatronum proteinivorum]